MPTQTKYQTLTAKEARPLGYHALTYDYTPEEYPLMERVLGDLRNTPPDAKPIDFAIVVEDDKHPEKLCVWRKNISG